MRILYLAAAFPASIAYAAALCFTKRGRIRLSQRFGFWGEIPRNPIWFHGASAGEWQGLNPVIGEVRKICSNPILATVTSATAIPVAASSGADVRMFPFDSEPWIRNALGRFRPALLVVSETEVWPGLFTALRKRGVPILIINGRMSARSVERYRVLFSLVPAARSAIARCLCIDSLVAARYERAGLHPSVISVAGNTKYDRQPLPVEKGEVKRERFQKPGRLIVIGNIRPGEERILFPAIRRALENFPSLSIAIVPRHEEKFPYFEAALEREKIRYSRWSEDRPAAGDEVLYVNRFGVLERLYADADGAFLGGSLEPFGGHNPLEPAPYGVYCATGPHTESTGNLVEDLVLARCMKRAACAEDLEDFFRAIHEGSPECAEYAENLRTYWLSQQGAVRHAVSAVQELIG